MTKLKSNIGLIGFMGTGKTTVGKLLAEELGLAFADTDALIESWQNATIPEIFAKHGEEFFRELESKALKALVQKKGLIIAGGGGAVLRPDNFAALEENALVICLKATPLTILRRIGQNSGRPLLAASDRLSKITALLAARAACYDRARYAVDTDDKTAREVAKEILAVLRAAGFLQGEKSNG